MDRERCSRRTLTFRSRRRLAAVAVGLVVVAASCGGADTTGSPTSSTSPSSGATTSEDLVVADSFGFTADLLGGGEFDAASLEGTPVVLWFWAPWCSTCRSEAPGVAAAAADQEGSVRVVGVAGRGPVSDMEQFVEDTGTADFDHVIDDDGDIWTSYGVISQPAYAFIDAAGGVEVFQGALGGEALAERMVALTEQ